MALSNRQARKLNKAYGDKKVRLKLRGKIKLAKTTGKQAYQAGRNNQISKEKFKKDDKETKKVVKEARANSKDKRLNRGAKKALRVGASAANTGRIAAKVGFNTGRGVYKLTSARKAALRKAQKTSARLRGN